MNIDEVKDFLLGIADGTQSISRAGCREMAKDIEQHHKDLMGLVEAWRNSLDGEPEYKGKDGISRYCADDLESLINPKD